MWLDILYESLFIVSFPEQLCKCGARIDVIPQHFQHLQHSLWVVYTKVDGGPPCWRKLVRVWSVSKEYMLSGCMNEHHPADARVCGSWLATADYT